MENFANYKDHRKAFSDLCSPNSDKCILFFKGETGMGKTSLLQDCVSKIPENCDSLCFNGKSRAFNISELFMRSINHFGGQAFSNLNDSLKYISASSIDIGNISQQGNNNAIEMTLKSNSNEEFLQRKELLTNSWVKDLSNINVNLIIIIDSYESLTIEMSDWFEGVLLPRIHKVKNIKVVVAGQKTPDNNNIVWGSKCKVLILDGVCLVKDWLPVFNNMGRKAVHFDREGKEIVVDSENWIAAICYAFKGRPEAIIKSFETLPKD